jgi:hypothetical protein
MSFRYCPVVVSFSVSTAASVHVVEILEREGTDHLEIELRVVLSDPLDGLRPIQDIVLEEVLHKDP